MHAHLSEIVDEQTKETVLGLQSGIWIKARGTVSKLI